MPFMRSTLDIEDDVLAATRQLERRQGPTAGQVELRMFRAALSGAAATGKAAVEPGPTVAGCRPCQAPGGAVVTNEQFDQLRDEAGL